MAALSVQGKAFNQTRQTYLSTDLALANTHWTRFRGLLGLAADDFGNGSGLWIIPCRGVHTLGMGFPIDVVYLDRALKVVDVQSAVKPWRFTPIRLGAASVLELPCHTAATTKTEVGDTIVITLSKDRPLP
ncbi:MAG TPA: DUF192 domain-containing protein [Candidatus Sulfotelmatobacter sp.]|nr:DUF192 domain-containing protein [Candidatus Sulfotelmatobacter sp.]